MNIMLTNFTKMVHDSGGLAKVTCNFANEMYLRGHDVTLVYSDVQEGDFFYSLDANIKRYDLRHFRGEIIRYPLYLKIKREMLRMVSPRKARTINNDFAEQYLIRNVNILLQELQPNIIISFQPAASKILLCDLQTKIPVVTMSHGDPEDYFHIYPKKEIPALEKSKVCQVLLPSFAQHLKRHLPNVKTVVIGNAVSQFTEQIDLSIKKESYKIIFIGRLSQNHKRPHLLIQAFSKLSEQFPQWNIEIWGAEDGKLYYKKLKEMIKIYHLEQKVFLKGTTSDVSSVLRQGDIFSFPSAYEGFGLSLAEAMSMGLPAIGYKSCSAVNELIIDGKNGCLCDDGIEDFAQKLSALMEKRDLRVSMGREAKKSMEKYAPKIIWDQWEKLMKQINKD